MISNCAQGRLLLMLFFGSLLTCFVGEDRGLFAKGRAYEAKNAARRNGRTIKKVDYEVL